MIVSSALTTIPTKSAFRHDKRMAIPNNALRGRASQDEILEAIANRLLAMPIGSPANVIVSDQPTPAPEAFASGKTLITVSPGAGTYPEGLWTGGHASTGTEDGSVIIGIYVRSVADKAGSFWRLLIGAPKGAKTTAPSLLWLKRMVLKQLLVAEDEVTITGSYKSWEPTVNEYNPGDNTQIFIRPLLRDTLSPRRATAPLDVPGMEGWVGMQITFACTWDWELFNG